MKKNIFIILSVCLGFTLQLQAQQDTSLRERLAKRQQAQEQQTAGVPQLSVRAAQMNQELTQDLSNATWIREVYRYLDLNKGTNAALYNPVQPIGDRMNLYTMIFKLMANGNLTGYKYLDGREVFTSEFREDFKDVLERLEIPFQQNGNIFTVNEYDIPSNEVQGYYIKEVWYFDQKQSVVDTKIIAICPVVFRQDDFGIGAERYPQFWIPYEDIRPYAARMPIMTSDKNNIMDKTIDDFFRLHLFDGEIYKTTNMENKILAEKYKTPEALKQAQEEIEGELRTFDQRLWITNDSTYIKPGENNKKGNKGDKKVKQDKSSSVVYSARDRRK
jgi:gliding motility associated protien GldN